MDRLPFTVGEVTESLALPRSTLYRLLVADCPMTDQEIKAMLDQFRQIAFIALDTVEAERHRSTSTTEGSDS